MALQLSILVPHKLKRPSQNSGQSVQTLFPLQRLRGIAKSVWPVRLGSDMHIKLFLCMMFLGLIDRYSAQDYEYEV